MPAADLQVPKPAEERSYLAFAAAALSLALGVGLILGILIPFSDASRLPRVVQAHGWTQLQGWLGLFVAGMGLRLMPRLAGRRPLPSLLTISVLSLLGTGAVSRVIAQLALHAPASHLLLAASGLLSALGALVLAAGLSVALSSRGRPWRAWRLAAWAGTFWWIGWGVLTAAGAFRARDGVVPDDLDESAVWVALLGVFSNFVWAVQSRSVPVFYGRRPPSVRVLTPPLALLNAGVGLIFASAFGHGGLAAGLALAGGATVWLAPTAGSAWGTASRLRPASRAAARFILAANVWAIVAGGLLVVAATTTSDRLRDAGLHAAGLGFMTTLILGMTQLLTPSFAGERITRARAGPESWLSWPALMLAALLRVGGSLLDGQSRALVIVSSGLLAWVALAAFAAGMARAARGSQDRPRQ